MPNQRLADRLNVPHVYQDLDMERVIGAITSLSEREWTVFFARLKQVNLNKLQVCKTKDETVNETLQTNAGLHHMENLFLQIVRKELV